ncbi:signal recognition particle, SRP9/SRP14 subunit [Tilletiopsis washingtonensis]|uniref:Signal recognition particle, SRP9/SRP14 subunit n=1 Tax=Tilletiopsis washingtonensis TaxID=58919 RepID=A0A316ZH52_9BASI|nr:signal recognition particle, SRP9/SRP14 subunit [Tilletiopsis washingtonensis]PWO01098.1 signal recognition particle, SRP9/SRP14 subunit [Tilletiopsis washingtonensis]
MVYYKSWAEFHSAATALYAAQPERTRYLIKAHPSTQSLVLKLTDDVQTIKYRTRSAIILNRFQALNAELTAAMAGAPPPAPAAVAAEDAPAAAAAAAPKAEEGAGAAGQQAPGAAAGKKKKKKGKK